MPFGSLPNRSVAFAKNSLALDLVPGDVTVGARRKGWDGKAIVAIHRSAREPLDGFLVDKLAHSLQIATTRTGERSGDYRVHTGTWVAVIEPLYRAQHQGDQIPCQPRALSFALI